MSLPLVLKLSERVSDREEYITIVVKISYDFILRCYSPSCPKTVAAS